MTGPAVFRVNAFLGFILLQTIVVASGGEGRGSQPLYFGYYYADGRWGDFTSHVWSYTNLYIAIPGGYETTQDWRPLLKASLQRASDNGKAIMLILGEDPKRRIPVTIQATLDIAAPYWSKVALVEVAHEEDLTPQALETRILAFKRVLEQRGLAYKPFGFTYTRAQALTGDAVHAPSASWVAIEAYVDPPAVNDAITCSNPPSAPYPGPAFVPTADCEGWVPMDHPLAALPGSVNDLNRFLEEAKRRVPPDKKVVLIMMAYDRNGSWTNVETLAALQLPVYLSAQGDPRVVGIVMFGYGQPGGTRSYPRLESIHRHISEQLFKTSGR
jgi:hypothetical protein